MTLKEQLRKRGPLGFLTMLVYRLGNQIYYRVKVPGIRHLLWLVYRILDIIVVRMIGSAEIPAMARIGEGLGLVHGGNGVIIAPGVVVGDQCTLYHQVTLGVRNGHQGAPVLGDHVFIGAGAKILGPVKIGNHAKIGANAVVLQDVPDGATAVGVPARILLPKEEADE
ncbi:hypothetical protein CBW65_08710 [Tumebacillus avium]|uniref:Serine acetyltransferase n=1 Tax=Tumebacillus avium TaxID=1903704 RepID=A0A1Y0INP2_9BACL|nr:DapH/DapD/GlmU-related protein [Tumebacillus avium]ARU61115.1 hypothetical protein CBW65_08710 [Tumebacillus avium]